MQAFNHGKIIGIFQFQKILRSSTSIQFYAGTGKRYFASSLPVAKNNVFNSVLQTSNTNLNVLLPVNRWKQSGLKFKDVSLNNINGRRHFSSETSEGKAQPSEGELKLKDTLRRAFPNATNIDVEDISGGCGSMYQINIESIDFKGLSTVKQHSLVNNALKQEIKGMHGVRIQTSTPK